METYIRPERSLWAELCRRPSSRNPLVEERVKAIIERVRTGGDAQLQKLSEEIDGRKIEKLALGAEDFAEAEAAVSPQVKEAIAVAAANIKAFHLAQKPVTVEVETCPGVRCI